MSPRAADGLDRIPQDDWSAGAFPSVARELIPPNGFEDGVDCLIDDDGLPYRRGGCLHKSNTNFGAGGLRFLWDGYLGAGQRTLFADSSDYGVLAADDVTPVNLGGAGLAEPCKGVELNGILYLDGGVTYGGSRKTAGYSTGTVSVTNGSAVVTGAGTSWSANADAGMLLLLGGRYYVVKSVDSNTQITLAENMQAATAAGLAYQLVVFGTAGKVAPIYTVVADRLIACIDNRAYESAIGDPQTFAADEYNELPGGVRILGAEAVRDVLMLFTTDGVWAVSGVAFDLTDESGNPQQRLEHINRDLVLWSRPGIATWSNALVVPAVDGVWLVDSVSAPVRISAGMTDRYVAYVQAGYKTGLATVYANHYLLPILDSGNAVVDQLVCRLGRTKRGTAFGWTRFAGQAGNVTAWATRYGSASVREPVLLAASRAAAGRVLDVRCFEPAGAVKADADGTVHQCQLVTREYVVSGLVQATARRVRARYSLVDAAADNPTIDLALAEEDEAWELQAATAPEATVAAPFQWFFAKRCRTIRLRLRSQGPAASLKLHTLEVLVRPSGKT